MYRLEKQIVGGTVLAKLEYEPCWTNEGKDENELGTFLYKAFIYNQVRKVRGTVNGVYYYVQQGQQGIRGV